MIELEPLIKTTTEKESFIKTTSIRLELKRANEFKTPFWKLVASNDVAQELG